MAKKTLLERTKWPMTDEEHTIALRKALKKTWRRVDRDKKFKIEFFHRLGIMTKSGNYTRAWKKYFAHVKSLAKKEKVLQ